MLNSYKRYKIICNSFIDSDPYDINEKCYHQSMHYNISCDRPIIYCNKCSVAFCSCCHNIMHYDCPFCLENPTETTYTCDECQNIFFVQYNDSHIYCMNCDNILCKECYENNRLSNKNHYAYCSNCINLL